jgi:hypothetical protein
MKPSILIRIGAFFGDIGRANAAVRTYERLDAMSDERLAARGLTRVGLVSASFDASFGKTAAR